MDYIKRRESLLKKIIAVAGSWQASGCNDVALEKKFETLLTELHPTRKTALLILGQYLEMEVAA